MLSLACLGQEPELFTVKYDKFQKVTTIRGEFPVESSDPKDRQTMDAAVYARIPDGEKPVMAFALSIKPKWLLDQPTLRFLVNDKLLEYSTRDIDYRIIYIVPFYDFDRIANGKTVEIQLSTFEGKLSEETLAAFRKLVELAKPSPPPDR